MTRVMLRVPMEAKRAALLFGTVRGIGVLLKKGVCVGIDLEDDPEVHDLANEILKDIGN